MSATRMQRHTVALPVLPAQAFALLVTHSAVRAWWLADRAVILARSGGIWVAAWGREEDAPDYVTAARISVYDPPQRLVLSDFVYGANEALPFDASFRIEFDLKPDAAAGATLQVIHDGFPVDQAADAFYADCQRGWIKTLNNLLKYAQQNGR